MIEYFRPKKGTKNSQTSRACQSYKPITMMLPRQQLRDNVMEDAKHSFCPNIKERVKALISVFPLNIPHISFLKAVQMPFTLQRCI